MDTNETLTFFLKQINLLQIDEKEIKQNMKEHFWYIEFSIKKVRTDDNILYTSTCCKI